MNGQQIKGIFASLGVGQAGVKGGQRLPRKVPGKRRADGVAAKDVKPYEPDQVPPDVKKVGKARFRPCAAELKILDTVNVFDEWIVDASLPNLTSKVGG